VKLRLWEIAVCSKLRQNLLVGADQNLVKIGRAGMDSSRSGLLSTLLMTLPLIVVPAVALLRPPGQPGVSTATLDASEADDVDAMFDGFDADHSRASKKDEEESAASRHKNDDYSRQPSSIDDDFFEDMALTDNDSRESFAPRSAPSPVAPSDPFMDDGPGHNEATVKSQESAQRPESDTEEHVEKNDARKIIELLNSMGALKTHWFTAGDKKPVGLAVFFRGDTEQTRIRFEAVGHSRDECAEDVLQQVTRWQQQNPQ
jgi:hypothetical protein